LTIVPAAEPSAIVAPDAPDRLTVKDSLLSKALSPGTVICIVFVVSPAAKVTVPVRAE